MDMKVVTSHSRRRTPKRTDDAGERRGLPRSRSDAGLVLPGPGVDADRVARLDEDRDGDHEAGLGRGRLSRACLRIAGEPRLRVRDDEVDSHRKLDANRL